MPRDRRLILAFALFVGCQSVILAQVGPRVGATPIPRDLAVAALNYWTPDRLQTALPRPLLSANSALAHVSTPAPRQPEVAVPGRLPGPTLGASADLPVANAIGLVAPVPQLGTYPFPFTRFNVYRHLYAANAIPPVFPYETVGKLFFKIGATNYVCSASVRRPHLVLTARHCIFDYDTSTWATNVVFYPGYYSGQNRFLHNSWPARVLTTWATGGTSG